MNDNIEPKIPLQIELLQPALKKALSTMDNHLVNVLSRVVDLNAFHGQITAKQMNQLKTEMQWRESQVCLALLPLAASFAIAPISNFYVGAIVKGDSGTFYMGANMEFNHADLGQTIHAEQSAITHAWGYGEAELTMLYVNYSPCGHCRQFMNELNGVEKLAIQLPNRAAQPLSFYLPDSFGPSDLNVTDRLLRYSFRPATFEDPDLVYHNLAQQALTAACESYAPYSKLCSGVAIALNNGDVFLGRYAENAAFNPSLAPLQAGLILMQMSRLGFELIHSVILAEMDHHAVNHRAKTATLLLQIQPTAQLIYYPIRLAY